MKLNIRHQKDVIIVDIIGGIDINSSALIETATKFLKKGTKKIIFNLKEVDFLDYNGLSVLAITYKTVLNSKGVLKLANIPQHVMELLRIVKLDSVFSIHEDIDKAIKSFELKQSKYPSMEKEAPEEDHPLRRKFPRLDMDVHVYYKIPEEEKGKNPLYSGLASNISGAGLFLRGINVLPAGTKINMDIVVGKPEKSFSLKAIIMWVADKQLQPEFYPGMGIQFLNIDQQEQEKLLNFIEKNIAK